MEPELLCNGCADRWRLAPALLGPRNWIPKCRPSLPARLQAEQASKYLHRANCRAGTPGQSLGAMSRPTRGTRDGHTDASQRPDPQKIQSSGRFARCHSRGHAPSRSPHRSIAVIVQIAGRHGALFDGRVDLPLLCMRAVGHDGVTRRSRSRAGDARQRRRTPRALRPTLAVR